MNIRKCRRAFTLIELLVVVTIIVLLIALLIPSLKGAKDMAYSAQCLSNLKQMGGLINGFEANNHGTIPGNFSKVTIVGGQAKPNSLNWTGWDNYLQAMMSNTVPIYQSGTPPPNPIVEKLFHCPSLSIALPADTTGPNGSALYYTTYSCNDSALTNAVTNIPPPPNSPPPTVPTPFSMPAGMTGPYSPAFKNISQITRPAEIIAVGDANQNWSFNAAWIWWDYDPVVISALPQDTQPSSVILPNWTYSQAYGTIFSNTNGDNMGAIHQTGLRYRHGERTWNQSGWANVLFLDGHAESKGINTIYPRNFCVNY